MANLYGTIIACMESRREKSRETKKREGGACVHSQIEIRHGSMHVSCGGVRARRGNAN